MIILILGFLGLCVGSFVNALVWRLHEKKDWVSGRSQCVRCGHELSPADLIPVLSWVFLKGKCRYCNQPISKQYPLVEIITAFIFVASYIYWPTELHSSGERVLFVSWLLESIGLIALAIYDWRYMILPNGIIYSLLAIAASSRAIYIAGTETSKMVAVSGVLESILVASGIFWLIFQLSKGRYIGYGDVRLGLVTGTILATPLNSFLMIFLASVLGTLFTLPNLITKKHKLNTRIPFGPFLIMATMITVLFGQRILDWYTSLYI